VSPYPDVRQDLASSSMRACPPADLLAALREAAGPELRSAAVFDEYRASRRAPASVTGLPGRVGSPERTLTDDEAAELRGRIVQALADRFGAAMPPLTPGLRIDCSRAQDGAEPVGERLDDAAAKLRGLVVGQRSLRRAERDRKASDRLPAPVCSPRYSSKTAAERNSGPSRLAERGQEVRCGHALIDDEGEICRTSG